jgi:mevalonate kinase
MPAPEPASPLGTGTAPGKVILLGEHAVVYGRPALAVPVTAVEARATVWASDEPMVVHCHFPQREAAEPQTVRLDEAGPDDALAAAARSALDALGVAGWPTWMVELASTVPTGRGMGSSAAVAVALVRALGRAGGGSFDDDLVGGLAYASEQVTHGTPSGIDNTVIALGRPIRFEQGVATPLVVTRPLTLLVADSGSASPTGQMVARLRERRGRRPEAYDGWVDQIGRLVDEATVALAHDDVPRLGRLMNTNHLVLQAMRLSTPALDRIVAAARQAGALGAKLSGGGGGGVALALVTPATAAAVTQACLAAGATQVIRTGLEATT